MEGERVLQDDVSVMEGSIACSLCHSCAGGRKPMAVLAWFFADGSVTCPISHHGDTCLVRNADLTCCVLSVAIP